MYEHRDPLKQFTVIDIDPYGSPSVFLDSAVQAVSEGGVLCITCTDTSVLCGVYPETCYSKYGSVSLRLKCGHEMGIRIFLSSLETHANRYKRYIVPLLSSCIDFYIRVFVQVFTSPSQVKRSLSKRSMIYACSGCDSHHLQLLGKRLEVGASKKYPAASGPPVDRTCAECGSTFKLGGPIWSEPTNDVGFVRSLLEELETHKQDYEHAARVRGLLAVVSEELPDVPLHYTLDQICNTLHCTMPNMLALRSAFMEQGYRISISHTHANALKTDAPNSVLWDIMRCWVKMKPVKVKPTSPAAVILSKEPKIEASFSVRKDANPPSRIQKLARFPENPEPNWGPKARAKRKAGTAEDDQSECEGSKRSKIQDENTE
jgi:tRNA (guanine26-N2/guanine27-N2)-dimethyltransferase